MLSDTDNQASPNSHVWTEPSIREALIKSITEIQVIGGNEIPDFTDRLVVLTEIPGFDSLTGVEVLTSLDEVFDTQLPEDIFYDHLTHRPRTMGESIKKIIDVLSSKVKAGAS